MDLALENWQKYIKEGIDSSGKHNLKYYAFDWDDNIVHMPTDIILLDKSGVEVGMGTADFAEYRSKIGKEPFEYNGKIIEDFAPNSFRNFRVQGDEVFLQDIFRAKPAPAWDDFVECLNSASIFAIVTARGHHPKTLKKAVYKYIMSNHDGIDSGKIIKNIKKYNKIFSKTKRDSSISGYLSLCKFYPVSFYEGSAASPEQAKIVALREFARYCAELNKTMDINIGFSDDDRRNIEAVEKHFGDEDGLPNLKLKYTGTEGRK